MEGTWKGSRHIAEGKEQVLELKQSLTHQLDCLGTIPIQHCLQGFRPLHTLPGEGPSRVFLSSVHQAPEESLHQLVQFHSAI